MSGSCISSAVLAAVLPRPIRADSTRPTRNPALANIHAVETPVIPPPTIGDVDGQRLVEREGTPRDFGSRSSQSGWAETEPWHGWSILATRLLRVKR